MNHKNFIIDCDCGCGQHLEISPTGEILVSYPRTAADILTQWQLIALAHGSINNHVLRTTVGPGKRLFYQFGTCGVFNSIFNCNITLKDNSCSTSTP